MKIRLMAGFLCLGMLGLTGCATAVFERHTSGKVDFLSRSWDYTTAEYEVLGPVEASGSSQVVLGMVTDGHEGYGLLMKAARTKWGGDVTSVMFIFSEYEFSGVLYPLIGKVSTTYYGTAVKSKVVSNVPNVRVLEK